VSQTGTEVTHGADRVSVEIDGGMEDGLLRVLRIGTEDAVGHDDVETDMADERIAEAMNEQHGPEPRVPGRVRTRPAQRRLGRPQEHPRQASPQLNDALKGTRYGVSKFSR
jgi:hypothetical protein